MNDFLTASLALVVGLAWLWAFIALLVVACLAVTGGITILDLADRAYERRQLRRGRVRVLDLRTGRERWAPVDKAVRRG